MNSQPCSLLSFNQDFVVTERLHVKTQQDDSCINIHLDTFLWSDVNYCFVWTHLITVTQQQTGNQQVPWCFYKNYSAFKYLLIQEWGFDVNWLAKLSDRCNKREIKEHNEKWCHRAQSAQRLKTLTCVTVWIMLKLNMYV